jgi:hypothetical protein
MLFLSASKPTQTRRATLLAGVFVLGALIVPVSQGHAAGPETLKVINNPSGGQALYGTCQDQKTMVGAMGAALRLMHNRFGERPQISRLFRTRGSHTLATYFQAHSQGKPITGMIIVSQSQARPMVWIAFDYAQRFRTSAPKLLTALNAATGEAPAGQAGPGAAVPHETQGAQPLHRVGFADGSGSISLPADWHIVNSGGGFVQAKGPKGEGVTFASMVQNIVDPHDGRGPMKASVQVGAMKKASPALWAMAYSMVAVPTALANSEWATMKAIAASYGQNGRVIGAQARVKVEEIQHEGAVTRNIARQKSDQYAAYNQGIDATRDAQSRTNQDFSNYIRGQTVVQDNDRNERGTIDYAQADVLVKTHPERYEYVPQADYQAGLDY